MEIKKKQFQLGFTFIELLVVISIMVLLFSLTTANYRDFQSRRNLDNAVTLVKSDLRLIQQYARGGRKPAGCEELQGYKLVASGTTYDIVAQCLNSDLTTSDFIAETRTLNPGLSISGTPVLFYVLGRGTNISVGNSSIYTIADSEGSSREITIESGGNIE